jgi:glycosyltransferase involved in cell wall biosynthesis
VADLPLVTIITPSYNQAAFLEETIVSVLGQDYPRIEYMIVDGGSTDDSAVIIRKYESGLAYWVSECDCGQANAVNKGLQRATGEIVGWVNSDDLLAPGAVRKAVAAFAAHPAAGVIYSDFDALEHESGRRERRRARPTDFKDLVGYGNAIPQPTGFFRRTLAKQIGGLDEGLHLCLDWDFWLRLSRMTCFDYLAGESLAVLREHAAAKSAAHPVSWAREYFLVLDRVFADPALEPTVRPLRRLAYSRAYWRTASAALRVGQAWPIGLQALLRSLELHPRWVALNPRTATGIVAKAAAGAARSQLSREGP